MEILSETRGSPYCIKSLIGEKMNPIIEYESHHLHLKLHLLSDKIKDHMKLTGVIYDAIYGIPRGGVSIATFLSAALGIPLITKFNNNTSTLVVDDIVDSGKTRGNYPHNDFVCLDFKYRGNNDLKNSIIFVDEYYNEPWIKYPWEGNETEGEDTITRIIELIGEDPLREGLKETPKRVLNSYKELFKGYNQNPKDVFKTFEPGTYDQLILLKNIEMYSICEHHLIPFIGKAHIAYIPRDKVIGISKLARLLEIYSKRIQIQERIGEEITTSIMKYLNPLGAACIIEATHLCMRMRGINKQNSTMITSSLKGVFLENPSPREELLKTIGFKY